MKIIYSFIITDIISEFEENGTTNKVFLNISTVHQNAKRTYDGESFNSIKYWFRWRSIATAPKIIIYRYIFLKPDRLSSKVDLGMFLAVFEGVCIYSRPKAIFRNVEIYLSVL